MAAAAPPQVRERTFPPGWHRWARSSKEGGDVCRHPEHAPDDYEIDWPDWGTGKPVALWACGTCWPRAQAQQEATRRYRRIVARLRNAGSAAAAEE